MHLPLICSKICFRALELRYVEHVANHDHIITIFDGDAINIDSLPGDDDSGQEKMEDKNLIK